MSKKSANKQSEMNSKTVGYWKGIDHLEMNEAIKPWLDDEFPERRGIPDINRRDVLKLMGGAMAIAGISAAGCRYEPVRKIVPFVRQEPGAVAGAKKQYATMATSYGYAVGLLVTQVDGRPIRIDGNPMHPASRGSLNAQLQAEILNVYDPDRLKMPQYQNDPASWKDAYKSLIDAIEETKDGTGVSILMQEDGSPALQEAKLRLGKKYPGISWHVYEPVNLDNAMAGATLTYGSHVQTHYRFENAKVIGSFDSNCLMEGPASIAYSQDIAAKRVPNEAGEMSRIYCFESHPTTLGMLADHRVRIKPSQVLSLAKFVAGQLGVAGAQGQIPAGVDEKTVYALISDLQANPGACAVVCGDHMPAEVHAMMHAINLHLNNVGSTVIVKAPRIETTNHHESLSKLVEDMRAKKVQVLISIGGNPAYTAPVDYEFGKLMGDVPLTAHVSSHKDETASLAHWQLPLSHFLESWGDGLAYTDEYTICQPLMLPLYDSQSSLQVIDILAGGAGDAEELVKAQHGEPENWHASLAQGFRSSPWIKMEEAVTNPDPQFVAGIADSKEASGMEMLILPDPHIHDGRNANNNWLQELPKPISNITWDNALYMSDATAKKLGVGQVQNKAFIEFYGAWDMVTVKVGDQELEVPVYVNLGQADDTLILHMGYGRTEGGEFLQPVYDYVVYQKPNGGGFNANKLKHSSSPVWMDNVQVTKTNKKYELASTQFHNTIDVSVTDSERHLIQELPLAAYMEQRSGAAAEEHSEHGKDFGEHGSGEDYSFYTGEDYKEKYDSNYQWAMTIDLATCMGCNACVTACQAENNIPTVGKEQVKKGREMHWIRVDRYYKGSYVHDAPDKHNGPALDRDNPPIYVQPVPCMHCEQAPCETVCPVAATVHSAEGINQMVYNRCVGTRYCGNNCPYKVRRFNFFHFSQRADQIPVLQMLQNPEVTVRFRGVMEKCTYCIQRINNARIEAKKEHRGIADGEVKTACQVACPTHSIVFGNKDDKNSQVAKLRADKRSYLILEELNTRPRTSYLAKIRNPHPDLEVTTDGGH